MELQRIIRDEIQEKGPITVARFMELSLQHPEFGYYAKGDPIGQGGDFITAPEISQMFGEIIGVWLAETWRLMGEPEFVLLELGPGRGTLMADVLRITHKNEKLRKAISLFLLDSNETFREVQKETLEAYCPQHISDLSEIPDGPLVFIANEFFDAMPVHQFVKTDQGWRERMVGVEGEKFSFVIGEQDVPLPLPQDVGFFELSPAAASIVKTLSAHVNQYGGAGLIIDYGYARPGGVDTLQAVSSHKFAQALERPGEVDLTAHVDFEALAIAAHGQGLKTYPITTQGSFLRAMGIELRADQLRQRANDVQADELISALHRLTDSSQMGDLFKVLAMSYPTIEDLPGFP